MVSVPKIPNDTLAYVRRFLLFFFCPRVGCVLHSSLMVFLAGGAVCVLSFISWCFKHSFSEVQHSPLSFFSLRTALASLLLHSSIRTAPISRGLRCPKFLLCSLYVSWSFLPPGFMVFSKPIYSVFNLSKTWCFPCAWPSFLHSSFHVTFNTHCMMRSGPLPWYVPWTVHEPRSSFISTMLTSTISCCFRDKKNMTWSMRDSIGFLLFSFSWCVHHSSSDVSRGPLPDACVAFLVQLSVLHSFYDAQAFIFQGLRGPTRLMMCSLHITLESAFLHLMVHTTPTSWCYRAHVPSLSL